MLSNLLKTILTLACFVLVIGMTAPSHKPVSHSPHYAQANEAVQALTQEEADILSSLKQRQSLEHLKQSNQLHDGAYRPNVADDSKAEFNLVWRTQYQGEQKHL